MRVAQEFIPGWELGYYLSPSPQGTADPLRLVPEGHLRVAQEFIPGLAGGLLPLSPGGTADPLRRIVPEGHLRVAQEFIPGWELGYYLPVPKGRLIPSAASSRRTFESSPGIHSWVGRWTTTS